MTGSVILALVLVIAVALLAAAMLARSRRGVGTGDRDLRRTFGPEYDRLVEQRGDPEAVKQELAERVRQHDSLTLRPLNPDERERYALAWAGAQERFIDDPRGAARQADQVVVGLLTAIGYPSEDRERQLALASVDHAYALSDYRQADELVQRSSSARGSGERNGRNGDGGDAAGEPTEALRQAVLHYRVMFKALLDGDSTSTTGRAHAVR